MSAELLAPDQAARLRNEPFTYESVGATAGDPPVGFASFSRARTLSVAFDDAVGALLTWQVQSRAGLRVAASDPEVAPGAVVVMRVGVGPVSVTAPCRVVYVVDEPSRQGFAYGTLPGHPESGEEAFVLEQRADGSVDFTVSAFSRPATRLARLGGPVGPWVQRQITARYLRSLDADARHS